MYTACLVLFYYYSYVTFFVKSFSVEPPKKGHFGDNINLSFIARPLLGGSQCMKTIENGSFWDLEQYPFYREV